MHQLIRAENAIDICHSLSDAEGSKTSSSRRAGLCLHQIGPGVDFFYSTNDWSSNDILNADCKLSLKTFFQEDSTWQPDVKNELQPEMLDEATSILSEIGKVVSCRMEVTSHFRMQVFVTDSTTPVTDQRERKIASLCATIECNDGFFQIEQRIIIPNNKSARAALLHSAMDRSRLYAPYANERWVKIDDEILDVCLSPEASGTFLHETLGHSLEADYYFSPESVFRTKEPSLVLSPLLTIVDKPSLTTKGTFALSDDGTPQKKVQLVESGKIIGVMSDASTSSELQISDTGNGRAASYEHRAIPRMRNTVLLQGKTRPKVIINQMRRGIYVHDVGGGETDSVHGNFLFQIKNSLFIRNGRPVAMCAPSLYRGNSIHSLNHVVEIGNDFAMSPAMCGKKGQIIDVSHGSPSILISQERLTWK